MRKLITYILLFMGTTAFGQLSLQRYDGIPVKKDSVSSFENPWAGGLNSAQFSAIDLNGDGIKDLVVCERQINAKVLTFINNGNSDSVDYHYAPQYESAFPPIAQWMLLVDYNCDGREDIYTWVSSGMTVYRNDYDTANGLQFTLVSQSGNAWSPVLSTEGSLGPVNMYMNPFDIPAITDIDNDGDVDVLAFCFGCNTVEYNRNYSMENYGNCDSLEYKIEDGCWGNFSEDPLTNVITDGIMCKGGSNTVNNPLAHPGGSSILALDVDADTDKDLVLGNINSYEFKLLINEGDTSDAIVTVAGVFPDFPQSSDKVSIQNFPAAYYVDVNNDGLKDLLASPNTTKSIRNYNSVWYYENQGTSSAPVFIYQKKNLLQDEMIEVGEGSFPAFFDHNQDGLMDLLIGNYGYWGGSGTYYGKISYYKNIGTPSTPSFELITRDYEGISAYNLNGLIPSFGDLDGDGDDDMILGDYNGMLHYFQNTGGAGNTASFILAQANYFSIDVGQDAAPQLVDLNKDGLLDLIVGERSGKIHFYENIGTVNNALFVNIPTNNFLGGVDVEPQCCSGYNAPKFVVNGSGSFYLLTGSEKGTIQSYTNIDNNIAGNFSLANDSISGVVLGVRSAISLADINGDGQLEMAVGTWRGGVTMLTLSGEVLISVDNPKAYDRALKVFPNPTSGMLTIDIEGQNTTPIRSIEILDIMGRLRLSLAPNSQDVYLVGNESPGVYFLKVITEDQVFTRKFILSEN